MPPLESIAQSPYYVGRITPPKAIKAVRHFNPSMTVSKGERWIAWRVEHTDMTSSIALGRLEDDGSIKKSRVLPIPGFVEDPRLLVVGGQMILQLARVQRFPDDDVAVVQEFYAISPAGKPEFIAAPCFYGNGLKGRLTKNWTAFDYGGQLHIHDRPGANLAACCNVGAATYHLNEAFQYPFGTLSGRTPALRFGDEYLAICGGHVPHPRGGSRYYIAAWTFAAGPAWGFSMQRISARPILWAAENDEIIRHPLNPQWHGAVVFPGGMIIEDGALIVSAGINDSWMALLRIPISSLDLQPIEQPFEIRDVWRPGTPVPPGATAVTVTAISLFEDGIHWKRGDSFLTTPLRAAALGDLVQPAQQAA